ncbi:biliverdin-producing heme oxygenase [Sphingobium sp. YR768]|uniref:biliverdin-producing heme oxygenase n=1 Tax=Sphingobium sp. YR768 TaxID=1884365 RepID=UPI0008BFD354|nr:biliverdin-producing heme oxygenase [Sphingobium sp. YR768]SES12000.1 heme oxygenase [Sphingobium sp. YR768]
MTVTASDRPIEVQSRAKCLKALTSTVHEGVDRSIMSASSFASIERYKRFLAIQYLFHRDVAALYADKRLQAAFPDLVQRCRLPLVVADMADLGVSATEGTDPAFIDGEPVDMGSALGWLYVAEGSNMGAAVLRKEAQKLGLTDDFGARHLAPAPEGPAPHWRAFTAALDAVELSEDEEKRAKEGALEAFARVQAHVDARLD